MLQRIDIDEARAHLAELFDKALQGNEIVVTRNDKPVVKLSPVAAVDEVSGLSPEEKAKAFLEWADGHVSDAPPLSDEAISRESIYTREDEQL